MGMWSGGGWLTGRIDAECEMRDEREKAEGQVVETPTADGARKVEKELFHHRDEGRVPKCKDASVDNLIGGLEGEGGVYGTECYTRSGRTQEQKALISLAASAFAYTPYNTPLRVCWNPRAESTC